MMNQTKCTTVDGGLTGSYSHPTCRSRPHAAATASSVVGLTHYSYQACGFVDHYQENFESPIVDTVLQVATVQSMPWVIYDTDIAPKVSAPPRCVWYAFNHYLGR